MIQRFCIAVSLGLCTSSLYAAQVSQVHILLQATHKVEDSSISDVTTTSSDADCASDVSVSERSKSPQTNTLLHQGFIELVKLGDYDAVKLFLDEQPLHFDINYQDAQGKTALMYATERWGKDDVILRDQILHLLMQRGARVTPVDKSGLTVHHYIAQNRDIIESKLLEEETRAAIERIIRKSNRTPSPMTMLQRVVFCNNHMDLKKRKIGTLHIKNVKTGTLKNKNMQSSKKKKKKK